MEKNKMQVHDFDDHLISVEDAQSGLVFNFAVGPTKGFRLINIQSDALEASAASVDATIRSAAETTARDYAKSEGWLTD